MNADFWQAVAHIGQFASIAEAVAVLATAVLAFKTLNSWRPENVGKRKFEVAENVLLATYDLKQRVLDVRRRLPAPQTADAEADFEQNRSHYWNRLGHLGGFAGDDSLISLLPLFRVYFGFEVSRPADRLFAAVQKVNGALNEIFTMVPANGTELSPRINVLTTLGWTDVARPDRIDREIDAAVREIEEVCRPVLEGKR
jgi:hypothetical protein